MKNLANIRLRHSMLSCTYIQAKNYIDCMDLGYLGDIDNLEKSLLEELRNTLKSVEKVLKKYYAKEEEIFNA